MLVGYVAVIYPLRALHDSWMKELDKQRLLLVRYELLKGGQGRALQGSKEIKAYLEGMEGRFLAGSSAPVAASELQEILKNLAGSYDLSSAKVLPPREVGPYLEVPVQVQLNLSTGQLLTLIYHLENHRKLLTISELEITAPRSRAGVAGGAGVKGPSLFQTRLTISGVIKATSPKGRPTI